MCSSRGFAAVGLWRPKDPANIGGTLRAVHVYGAKLLCIAGDRSTKVRHATDVTKAARHIPVLRGDDLRALLPFDCAPIAVDLVPDATPLPEFVHPPRAMYIFGPEDGTLGASVLSWCKARVFVPTQFCMNLAATVNVVLYDRLAKTNRRISL